MERSHGRGDDYVSLPRLEDGGKERRLTGLPYAKIVSLGIILPALLAAVIVTLAFTLTPKPDSTASPSYMAANTPNRQDTSMDNGAAANSTGLVTTDEPLKEMTSLSQDTSSIAVTSSAQTTAYNEMTSSQTQDVSDETTSAGTLLTSEMPESITETGCVDIVEQNCVTALPENWRTSRAADNEKNRAVTSELLSWGVGCHQDYERFLCSLRFPKCGTPPQGQNFRPCRKLCENVESSCQTILEAAGYDQVWPTDCANLPSTNCLE